jgi:hypothetical protein
VRGVPNGDAPPNSLDRWLKTVNEVEEVTGMKFDAANKAIKPAKSWVIPKGCHIQ